MDPLTLHRLQFAFTVTYHYLFPQLTMGLALLILVLKTLAVRWDDDQYDSLVRFWTRILAVSFVMGVVTGIPLEFQFGTNWSRFSRATGGTFGQTLALEGVFAFFLESSFLYLLVFGEKRMGPIGHWVASALVWFGTWLSGFFIICANAFMQHPLGVTVDGKGILHVPGLSSLLLNPWAYAQFAHTMLGAVITGSFVMSGTLAFYILRDAHVPVARKGLRVSLIAAALATAAAAFPTGDAQAKLVYAHQPVTFAAMEGHFYSERGAGLTLIGQPDMDALKLDNPIVLPRVLSLLTHQRWDSEIHGLTEFPRDRWPDNVPLLYYAYHIMAGLGTIFIGVTWLCALWLVRGKLFENRALLWLLMLVFPLPFVANTAGWLTAELGRQPFLVYGLLHTRDGSSAHIAAGTTLFSLLGFMGLYAVLSLLFFFIVTRIVGEGPA
jgi:cytochrome bd ubiquinol oxidase subunit I